MGEETSSIIRAMENATDLIHFEGGPNCGYVAQDDDLPVVFHFELDGIVYDYQLVEYEDTGTLAYSFIGHHGRRIDEAHDD